MTIAWGSLGIVVLASLAFGVAVVALVAFALVGLSARQAATTGARSMLSPAGGTAVAVVCLAAAAAIVGYGLWIIVS